MGTWILRWRSICSMRLEHVQHYVDLGFDEVYVHNVGRNQEDFIRAYGERVIPKLSWPEGQAQRQ